MIRRWLRDQSLTVPSWVMVLEAAKEWGMSPWAIEDEMPQTWWDRWRVVQEETGRLDKKRSGGSTDGGIQAKDHH